MVISDFSRLQVLAEGGEAIIYVYNSGLIKDKNGVKIKKSRNQNFYR